MCSLTAVALGNKGHRDDDMPGNYATAQAWNFTGDVLATKQGDKPWIAEMYGYVFAAAKANVWHNPVDYFHWMYPGFFTAGEWANPTHSPSSYLP